MGELIRLFLLVCFLQIEAASGGVFSGLPILHRLTEGIKSSTHRVDRYASGRHGVSILSRVSFGWADEFMLCKRDKALCHSDLWHLENTSKSMYNLSMVFESTLKQIKHKDLSIDHYNNTKAVDAYTAEDNLFEALIKSPIFRALIAM